MLCAVLALAIAACGSDTTSEPQASPSPTPSPGVRPGGQLSGRYLLEVKLDPSCKPTLTATIPVAMTAAGTSPYPGVQALLDSTDYPGRIDLELRYTNYTLEGGLGTIGDGVPSSEGPQVWMRAIGTGSVTQSQDGFGEVLSGTMKGYLEIEGSNPCDALGHTFKLRHR